MNPPPDPTQYKGQTLRSFLEAIRDHLTRSRIQPDACVGITVNETPGGVQLSATAGGGSIALIHTTGTITARSGVTPGTGQAKLVNWNGTALSDGATITLRNLSGTAGVTGKYGMAVKLFGVWWLVVLEC